MGMFRHHIVLAWRKMTQVVRVGFVTVRLRASGIKFQRFHVKVQSERVTDQSLLNYVRLSICQESEAPSANARMLTLSFADGCLLRNTSYGFLLVSLACASLPA